MQIRKNLSSDDLCGHHALELANRLSTTFNDDVDALVLSLRDVTDVDVSGVAALVRIYSNLERTGRRLILTEVPSGIHDYLNAVGLAHVLLANGQRPRKRFERKSANRVTTIEER